MVGFRRHPLVRFLSSTELAAVLLLVIGVSCASATFIEARIGSDGARALVYNAHWFEAVLGLLVINLILLFFRRMPYKWHQSGFVIIHLAMIVILVGAGITRFFGYEGTMAIREGESANFLFSSRNYVQLTVDGQTRSYPVRLYHAGSQSASHRFSIEGGNYQVAVQEYWPHYEERLVAGEGGVPAIALATIGENGMQELSVPQGEARWLRDVRVLFADESTPDSTDQGARGMLRIRAGGQSYELAVPEVPPAVLDAGGYRFTITEFQPDFKVGQKPDLSQPMNNPMIRVTITGPEGQQGERVLFAYHPDFSMSHGGQPEAFPDLHLLYHYENGAVFRADTEGRLFCRSTLPLEEMDMSSAEVQTNHPAGQSFEVPPLVLFRDPASGFAFVLKEFLPSGLWRGALSEDAHQPAAVRVAVRDQQGQTGTAVVISDVPAGAQVRLGDREVTLHYGAVKIPVPYSIHLDDFVLTTYPGSDNPASYESRVRLYDPERGIDGKPVRIYMNHPLTHRGFKHFQSSYDADHKGTVLSVNYDPGKWPTYIGYMMISLGFVLVLSKRLIWPRTSAAAARDKAVRPPASVPETTGSPG